MLFDLGFSLVNFLGIWVVIGWSCLYLVVVVKKKRQKKEEDDSDGGCKSSGFERGGCEFELGGSKESKNSNSVDL